MRRLNSANSRTKFNVAITVLIASILAFVGDASAEDKVGLEIGDACICHGACRVVTMCLVNYCIKETVCGDCEVCTASRLGSGEQIKPGAKVCLYRKGEACVTAAKTYRRHYISRVGVPSRSR